MERLTRYDPVNRCYKLVRDPEPERSVIQELGVYESIHAKEIYDMDSISDIRKLYGIDETLSDYWEK